MRLNFWILSASLLICPVGIYCAEVISWQTGIQETSHNNPELSAAKSAVLSSAFQVKGARSAFLPVVSANASYNYDSSDSPKYYSATLNATENLFSGFADVTRVDQAKYKKSSSEANLESVKAKISFDLKSAFMGLLYSQKYIKLTEDIIKRREANLKLVQLRFESGRENIGSLNLSKAYLAESKLDHFQALNSKVIYQTEMAKVLGRDDHSIEVTGVIPTQNPPQELDFNGMIKDIPDYKKAYFNELTALATIDLSNSAFYPTLNLTQSVGKTGRESSSPASTWVVGAAITIPFFNGGKDYYAYKSAAEDYRSSALGRKSAEATSMGKLKSAYTAYAEAVMKLEVAQAFALAANSRERIAKAQYNNGLLSFNDWDTIENELIIRQKALLQSERDRVIAEASWEQAQGRGVIP